jgi:hypothetical protein
MARQTPEQTSADYIKISKKILKGGEHDSLDDGRLTRKDRR